MKPEDVIKALRCSDTPGEHDCTGCPYLFTEKLNAVLAKKFGCEEVENCDCDKIALDAAYLLEAYRATNHTPEECAAAFEELAAYRAAEQDGTLLRLPCKPGTRWKNKFGEIYVVHGFHFDSKHGWQVIHYKEENKMVDDYIHSVDFKYWERNMVPAEAALKEQNGILTRNELI